MREVGQLGVKQSGKDARALFKSINKLY